MVGDHAEGNIGLFVIVIGDVCDLADMLHDILHGVNLKQVVYTLHHTGETLQAHAGVNVLVLHLGVVALAVAVKLREHEVPDFNDAVAVACLLKALKRAVSLAAVKVNLRAGAARAGSVLPEVVGLAETDDSVMRNADLLFPDLLRFIVTLKNGDPQSVCRDRQISGQELPRPLDRLTLEVFAEGEVAEHLKERAVTRRLTHALDIRRADALLAGGHADIGRHCLPKEKLFQRCHTGVDEQKGVIALRHEGSARHAGVRLALKKCEITLAEFIQTCPFHVYRNSFPFDYAGIPRTFLQYIVYRKMRSLSSGKSGMRKPPADGGKSLPTNC